MSFTSQELVSVLIPCYNSEKYIAQSIKSVQNQTYKNLEIIVVDNASEDNTANIVEEFCKKDPRIRFFINEKNCGAPYSLNRAIKETSGKYIAFHDSDDIMFPDKIWRCTQVLESQSDIDVLYSGAVCISENGLPLNKEFFIDSCYAQDKYFVKCMERIIGFGTWGFFLPSTVARETLFDTKIQINYDFDFLIRLILSKKIFTYIDEPMLYVRRHPASLSNAHSDRWLAYIYKKNLDTNSIVGAFLNAGYHIAQHKNKLLHV